LAKSAAAIVIQKGSRNISKSISGRTIVDEAGFVNWRMRPQDALKVLEKPPDVVTMSFPSGPRDP
jgi:hypothetical protein